MDGSLSMASTAVLLAMDTVINFGVNGRSALYSKYNNGPMELPLE
jgi:hypothetical protein